MAITACTLTNLGPLPAESPNGTSSGIPIGTAFADRLVAIVTAGDFTGASLSGAVGGTNFSTNGLVCVISAFIPSGTTTTLTVTGGPTLGSGAPALDFPICAVYAIAGATSNVPTDFDSALGSLAGGTTPMTVNIDVLSDGAIIAAAGDASGAGTAFTAGVDSDGTATPGVSVRAGSREYASGGTFAVTNAGNYALLVASFAGSGGGPTDPPSNTSVPTLSDTTPVVGQVITAGTGTWTESPTSYGIQFYLDGSPVGSRSPTLTYTVQAADAGKVLSVGSIATNAIGDSAEAFSADSSPIAHTWQLVGVAVSAVNASGNYTLTLPSGSQSGDVVVAAIAMRSNVGFTVPAGWTQANQDTGGNTTNGTTASDTSSLQAYIIRGGSAPSMVFTRTGGSRALGVVAVYRYTDQSAPPTFDTSVLTPLGAAATAISGAGLTTGAAGELIVGAVFGARNITVSNFRATNPATGSGSTDTTSNPADGAWTERADSLNGTSPTVGVFLADSVRTTAGATGSLLATASASALHAIGAMAFAPPASGGPTSTGSLAAVDSGADEGSGAGTVAITGAAAVAETARDTIASAGTVPAAGSLSTAESGSDSLAASGTASFTPATGDLLVVDLGTDTIAAAGSAAIAGVLAVADAAADNLVTSGTIAVAAAAAVVDVGSDQAALAGVSAGTGAVAAQDAGADSLAGSGSSPATGAISSQDIGSDSAFLFAGKISTGAIVVTDAGSDSVSSSGLVALTGAHSTADFASDTIAAAATCTIVGGLSSVGNNPDQLGIIGALISAGTAIIVDSGHDRFDLSGGSLVSGFLAATEASDTLNAPGTLALAGLLVALESGPDAVRALGVLAKDLEDVPVSELAGWIDVLSQLHAQIDASSALHGTVDIETALGGTIG